MNRICTEKPRDIIEVPLELRGLSDEEIIRNSEKNDKKYTGKWKNGASRPSKRERIALKQKEGLKETEKIAIEIFEKIPDKSELPREKQKLLEKAFTPQSAGYSRVSYSDFIQTRPLEAPTPHSIISEPPKPISGRVLKASFGSKTEKPKAIIVSAADLAQQKAEERAKKIRDFFRAKHPEATTMPDGQPIKRGRGRPRKNPLI